MSKTISLIFLNLLLICFASRTDSQQVQPLSQFCALNRRYATVSPEIQINVAFRLASVAAVEPDPMQTRRFNSDGDYSMVVRSSNPLLGIVRFIIGILPHSPAGAAAAASKDVGRLLPASEQVYSSKNSSCHAFYCDVGCNARSEVRFNWTAPSNDGAACVEIRALVGLKHDEESLIKSSLFLCRQQPRNMRSSVYPAAPCCACGSANYLLRFHGRWNPPLSDPAAGSAGQQLSWSELLGTTHDDSYALWEFGSYSSAGVSKLCEQGDSSTLEEEIKSFGTNSVLTVIKARDLPLSPGGSNSAGEQVRSAILTVNASHHLVTFLSRPVPTPGWCVGVSLLDLCQANCTWAERLTLPLRLWATGERKVGHQIIDYLDTAAARPLAVGNSSLAEVSLQRIPPRRPATEACGRP